MKAFLDTFDNLILVLDRETPEELGMYEDISDLIAVCAPRLVKIDPRSIGAKTNAPIFQFMGSYFWLPDYLTVDHLESLRDNGRLLIPVVK